MRQWKPFASNGRWLALVLAIVFSGGSLAFALLSNRHFEGPPSVWDINMTLYVQLVVMFLMLFFATLSWLRFAQVSTLNYGIDRNAVYISALGNTEIVPLAQIRRIDFGMQVNDISNRLLQGIGCYWGVGLTDDGTEVYIRSTVPPSRCLFITTENGIYAIAPSELEAFVQDIEQRGSLGSTKQLAVEVIYGPWLNTPFWHDTSSRLFLGAALCINLITVGILAWHYPNLAETVQMRFNAIGDVAELRPRYQALFLPLAALGVTTVNLLAAMLSFRYEKLISHLLQGASVIVQIMFCVAIYTVVRS